MILKNTKKLQLRTLSNFFYANTSVIIKLDLYFLMFTSTYNNKIVILIRFFNMV